MVEGVLFHYPPQIHIILAILAVREDTAFSRNFSTLAWYHDPTYSRELLKIGAQLLFILSTVPEPEPEPVRIPLQAAGLVVHNQAQREKITKKVRKSYIH